MVSAANDSGSDNFMRLISSGISPEDAVQVAVDAAVVYDRNRKPRGAVNGALGSIGREVYRGLCRTADFEPDPEAFTAYRRFTAADVGERLVRSEGAVGSAVNRLIQHGFVEKRREGRSFSVKLLVPTLALVEYGEARSRTGSTPGTANYDYHRPLGEKVLALFPREPLSQ